MKAAVQTVMRLVLLAALTVACTGCATYSYLVDRTRDAADVFTVTVGTGGGAKVRVGPVQVAAISNSDLVGLRAGKVFWDGNGLIANREVYSPLPILSSRYMRAMFGLEGFSHGVGSISSFRRKDIIARSPFPFVVLGDSAPYYTQIEAAGGLLLTLRLGFNPGELVDFVLGWLFLDIYSDDVELDNVYWFR